jgi:hypothetical protein
VIHLGTQPYDGPLPVAPGHDLTAHGLQLRAAGDIRWVAEGVWSWTPDATDTDAP